MTKKHPIRIVEIHLKKSRKNPKFCHAIALLFPCSHKEYLGLCKTPGNMGDRDFMRVQNVRIWEPTIYEVMDKVHCILCPSEDYWIRTMPRLPELEMDNVEELE